MPLTCLLWAPHICASLDAGPKETLPPGLPVQRLLLSSQTPAKACVSSSNILLGVSYPPQPPQLQLQSPCCAPGRRLAGGGGLLSPWPLLSILRQLPAKYPWDLVREDFLLIFFPGEIIPPLVTWISAFSYLGSLTSSPHPIPAPLMLKDGAALFPYTGAAAGSGAQRKVGSGVGRAQS